MCIYSYQKADCWVCGWVMHITRWLPLPPLMAYEDFLEYCFWCFVRLNFCVYMSNLWFQILPPLHLLFWLIVVLVCDGVYDEMNANWHRWLLVFHSTHITQGESPWTHHSHIDDHLIAYVLAILLWTNHLRYKPYFGHQPVGCPFVDKINCSTAINWDATRNSASSVLETCPSDR